jgi:hypothetical protein
MRPKHEAGGIGDDVGGHEVQLDLACISTGFVIFVYFSIKLVMRMMAGMGVMMTTGRYWKDDREIWSVVSCPTIAATLQFGLLHFNVATVSRDASVCG